MDDVPPLITELMLLTFEEYGIPDTPDQRQEFLAAMFAELLRAVEKYPYAAQFLDDVVQDQIERTKFRIKHKTMLN